jgi:hypothetical protein
MSFAKRNKKMYRVWVVISVIAVLSMIAFTIAPILAP